MRINVAHLVPGMITAEDVYTYSNQLIIPKHTVLNDKAITRLEFYSILAIRIVEDPRDVPTAGDYCEEPEIQEEVGTQEELPYSQVIQSSPQFQKFKKDYEESLHDFETDLNDIVEKGSEIDVQKVMKDTVELFHEESTTFGFFHMLLNMRDYDDTTYAHSINVALICNVLAGWLGFSDEDKEIATLCGLFHDIGKLAIPDEIVKKTAQLTDEEYTAVKKHTLEGYNILKPQNINNHIKNAALMHHERCDGTGYPLGLTRERIDRFAKIVAIADVYDAMTAARCYRGPMCPFTVIEIFEKEGFQKYESEYILCFLENVVMTYINHRVRLSNGMTGDIVFINKQHLSRPMVKCKEGFIDLFEHKDISIEEIL